MDAQKNEKENPHKNEGLLNYLQGKTSFTEWQTQNKPIDVNSFK